MNIRLKKPIVIAVAFAAFLVASASYAETATVDKSGAGMGEVTGYEVSDISYASSGDTITGVSFGLDDSAEHVSVKLVSSGSTSYACGATSGAGNDVQCAGLTVPIAAVDGLTVVASN
jgi:hypothetical protein